MMRTAENTTLPRRIWRVKAHAMKTLICTTAMTLTLLASGGALASSSDWVEMEGARILALHGSEAYTTYVPKPGDPVFMKLIEKTFGKDITTRTWETVRKCAQATSTGSGQAASTGSGQA